MKGFVKPKAVVLNEGALVPEENLISPPPNQFTHELTRTEPFYFREAAKDSAPDGELPEGTRVLLMVYDGGTYCRIADEQGLYVELQYSSLKKI